MLRIRGGRFPGKRWKARKTAKARLVAKGSQDPDIRDGNDDIAGCASRCSSHLQLISVDAPKGWKI